MSIGTKLYTLFAGRKVGVDNFGNRYFEEKRQPQNTRRRRWVLYKGISEPSKIPAEWHGWLHYITDTPPTSENTKKYSWIKPHTPNLTGTKLAYFPPGDIRSKGTRKKATGDYEAWKPE